MGRFPLILAVWMATSPALGATLYETGDKLFADCQSAEPIGILQCIDYIEGASDQLELMRADRGKASCVPSGITGQGLREIMVDYLRVHAEARPEAAASVVRTALSQAWNCVDMRRD
jgi:hypothetical protein